MPRGSDQSDLPTPHRDKRRPGGPVKRVVISLAGTPRRRQEFFAQELSRGIEVFDAVDCRGLGPVDWAHAFDDARFEERYSRPPLPGEVGCTLSHLAVWQSIAQSQHDDQAMALVVEDDAVFADRADEVIAAAAGLPYDLVVLCAPPSHYIQARRLGLWRRALPAEHTAGLMWPNVVSTTAGYVVRVGAARAVTRAAPVASWLADDFVFWRDWGLSVGRIDPPVVTQREGHSVTTIVGRRGAVAPEGTVRYDDFLGPRSQWHRRRWFVVEEMRTRLPLALRTRPVVRRLARALDDRTGVHVSGVTSP